MNKHLRRALGGLVTGLTIGGTVWAGVGIAPVDDMIDPTLTAGLPTMQTGPNIASALPSDAIQVGASKISLKPRPADFGGVWETDRDACLSQVPNDFDPQRNIDNLGDTRLPWAENPKCIYMGGYGIGPSNPVTSWDDEYGLWVRTTVFTDANDDTVSLTIIDAEGYFADYNTMCGELVPRCGSQEIADDVKAELGLPSSDGIIIGSTHSHTSLDLIGGWGGVPGWYMDQVATAIKDSIKQAYQSRVPVRLETGEVFAREFNAQRRDGYHSAEDPSLNWVRAIDANDNVVATVAAYASHPVSADEGSGVGNGDFPPIFSKAAETEFGGVAMIMQNGLGNISPRGGLPGQGVGLAARLPDLGAGTPVNATDIKVKRVFWDQPATNGPLGVLGSFGFFDRPFSGPAVVDVGRQTVNRCRSASPVGVRVSVTAAKIGGLWITAAPGEVFSNFTNTLEEKAPINMLALAQANDALGYMPQSFEGRPESSQGAGFVDSSFYFEYEDAYAIDKCFGDMALENTLAALGSL